MPKGFHISYTGTNTIANNSFTKGLEYFVPYPCEESCSCSPFLITFLPGSFIVSLYGGSGGYADKNAGGKGGMVKTILTFRKKAKYYLFIAGKGGNQSTTQTCGKKGYNGGGDSNSNRGGGGGATDLRKKEDDLHSRILVAAGGGSGYKESESLQQKGGDGGGLEGEFGGIDKGNVPCIGTQNDCINGSSQLSIKGGFGLGANESYGGGGAGWYGGGGASFCGSSGGSSYYGNFSHSETISGVNEGNGFAVIESLNYFICSASRKQSNRSLFIIVLSSLLFSN